MTQDEREQPTPGDAPRLLHVFPTFGPGGVQIRMASILNHFGRRAAHAIMALDGNFAVKSRLDRTLGVEFLSPARKHGSPPARLWANRRQLKVLAPDLLLTYNWGAIEWALANRISPVCRHIHLESGFGPEEATGQIPRRVWIRRLALAKTERIVVPSLTLVDIAEKIWRLPGHKILRIANGVDCAKFAQAPSGEAFRKAEGELIVGTIAPLRREKNLQRLLRVFAGLKGETPSRLLIIGDGPEKAALEDLAAALGITERVILAGHVEAPERVIGWIDVYALSSDTEQMPNTILQAMAAGKPVAGLGVGDVGSMVAPENRPLIAAAGDDDGLGRHLQTLLDDAALRRSVGDANRAHARAHYDQMQMFGKYGRLFGFSPPDDVKNTMDRPASGAHT